MPTTDNLSDEVKHQRLLAGVNTPLADRQERWERFRAWSKSGKSLSQIVTLELETNGNELTRERVRAILKLPKPGTVEPVPTNRLLKEERRIVTAIVRWQRRGTAAGNARADEYLEQLRKIRNDLVYARRKSARRRAAKAKV